MPPSATASPLGKHRRIWGVLGAIAALLLVLFGGARFIYQRYFAPPTGPRLEVLPPQGDHPAIELAMLAATRPVALFVADTSAFADPIALDWVAVLGDLASAGAIVHGVVAAPEVPAWMRGPPTKMLTKMADEFPFPLRLDFGGALCAAFEFHEPGPGVVLLGGAAGVSRLGGHVDATKVAALYQFFAVAAPSHEAAPELRALPGLGGLRVGAAVGVVFLARPVTEREAPALRGSPLGLALSGFAPPDDASVRLVTFLAGARESSAELVIGGELEGFVDRKWRRVRDDAALRAALGIQEHEAAIVAIDAEGVLRIRAIGRVPMWRLGAVASVLGLPPP
jgi:hypothetical protein